MKRSNVRISGIVQEGSTSRGNERTVSPNARTNYNRYSREKDECKTSFTVSPGSTNPWSLG